MNEAETRVDLIDPALRAADWDVVDTSRVRRAVIPLGRLQGAGVRAARDTADWAKICGEAADPGATATKSQIAAPPNATVRVSPAGL